MPTATCTFPGPSAPQRRYPWDEWTNGRPCRITLGEDYDIPTENMRANLHMRARSMGCKVQTHKATDDRGEGLIFQFSLDSTEQGVATEPKDGQPDDDTLLDHLHADLTELYELARREVSYILNGRRRKYAAVRFKQKIDRVYGLVAFSSLWWRKAAGWVASPPMASGFSRRQGGWTSAGPLAGGASAQGGRPTCSPRRRCNGPGRSWTSSRLAAWRCDHLCGGDLGGLRVSWREVVISRLAGRVVEIACQFHGVPPK